MALTRIKPTSISNSAPFNMSNIEVQGNIAAGNVKTDNLLYANGVVWDLQQAAGLSSHIQFNTNNNFDSSANLTFNKSTKTLTTDSIVGNVTGNVTGNLIGNVTGNTAGTHTGPVVGNVTGNVTGNTAGTHTGPVVGNVTGNVTGNITGTILTASQPQITSVGTLTSLTVTNDTSVGGNLTVTGNLTISGTSTIINSTVIEVADVSLVLAKNAATTSQANGAGIIINGAGANFTYNNATNSFVSTHRIAVDGGLVSNVNASNIATGTIPSSILGNSTHYIGTTSIALNRSSGAQALTGITSIDGYAPTVSSSAQPNITSVSTSFTGLTFVANGNIAMTGSLSQIAGGNLVSATYLTGTLTTSAQPNITSVGTLTNTTMGASNSFTGANLISANYFTGTLTTAAQPSITSIGTLTTLAIAGTGSITGANAITANYITSSTLITANALSTTGLLTVGPAAEVLVASGAVSTSTTTYNFSSGATFYHSSVSLGSNWTANISNVPTTDARSLVFTIIVAQGTTPYIPNAIQINGTAQTLKWSNGSAPDGKANAIHIFSFALLRTGSTWAYVLGSYTTYS